MAKVLVIDGDAEVCETISAYLEELGHESLCHGNASGAVDLAEKEGCDLVMLSLHLPDGRGVDIMPGLKLAQGHPDLILLLGQDDGDGDDIATRYGAWDHIGKPVSGTRLAMCLRRALKYREQSTVKVRSVPYKGFVAPGRGSAIKELMHSLLKLAAAEGPVLVFGEKGAMKSRYARSVHDNSARSGQPFVMFDCMSLPRELALRMFVTENSAKGKTLAPNILEQVGRGTLYVKNIEAMPLDALEALGPMLHAEKGRCGTKNACRLVASADQEPGSLSGNGALPEVVADALTVNMLRVPPLRRRKEDIPDIVSQRLLERALNLGGDVKGVSSGFLDALADYDWPGNDVELAQVLDRACTRSGRQPMLFLEHLPEALGGAPEVVPGILPGYREYRDSALSGAEKAYLLDVIEQSQGNHKIAESITGLSRSRLYELLSKYDLTFKGAARKNNWR